MSLHLEFETIQYNLFCKQLTVLELDVDLFAFKKNCLKLVSQQTPAYSAYSLRPDFWSTSTFKPAYLTYYASVPQRMSAYLTYYASVPQRMSAYSTYYASVSQRTSAYLSVER